MLASREAAVILLDVSNRTMSADQFELARRIAANLVQQKLMFSPRDEVGIVLTGSKHTLNRLHASVATPAALPAGAPQPILPAPLLTVATGSPRFANVAVAQPIGLPTLGHFHGLTAEHGADAVSYQQQDAPTDMVESLLVAADLIYERTGQKRYQKRIFYISDVGSTVRRKEDLQYLISFMKAQQIHLVVIGVDFENIDEEDEEHEANAQPKKEELNWDKLTSKQQNERVLRFACDELGDGSLVVPVSDALEALSTLRKRFVAQRSTSRCVLSIGDVRLAVHLFTKTLVARMPPLKKSVSASPNVGAASATAADHDAALLRVITDRRYFLTLSPGVQVDPSTRAKAYRYGKSLIPFTDIDVSQMKFHDERSLQALGFVPIASVPMYLLLGGVRAVAPAPGDHAGARALAALVQSMHAMQHAMMVRFVRHSSADPVIGVCIPANLKADERADILYFATLPFAEDIRHYRFSSHLDLNIPKAEERAVDNLVDSLTMDSDCLKPNRTFNPALQYYYQCVQSRFLSRVESSDKPGAVSGSSLPPIRAEILQSSCHFGRSTSVLAAHLRGGRAALERCKELFTFEDPRRDDKGDRPAGGGKWYWFQQQPQNGGHSQGAGKQTPLQEGDGVPSHHLSLGFASEHQSSITPHTPSTASTSVSEQLAAAARLTAGGYMDANTGMIASHLLKVTSTDPVGTFQAMIRAKGQDLVDRAIFELSELTLKLVRSSVGTQHYAKCDQCIDALRVACVTEGEPRSFHQFLIHLRCAVREGEHERYWDHHILQRHVRPITQKECAESDLVDDAAADAFLKADRAPPPVVDNDDEEDLFGQLE